MRTAGVILLLLGFPLLTHAALININTADASALDTLPGIGVTKAAAIISYRSEHGPFTAIEDIQNVSGIGPATFAKLQPLIAVSDEAPDPAPPLPPDTGTPEQPPSEMQPTLASPAIASAPTDTTTQLVNINTADQTTLEGLPRIGPVTATAIIAYRAAYGPFRTIEDIVNVQGIGDATLAQIRALITVGEGASPTEPPAPPVSEQAPQNTPPQTITPKPIPPPPVPPQKQVQPSIPKIASSTKPLATSTSYTKMQGSNSVIRVTSKTAYNEEAASAPAGNDEPVPAGALLAAAAPMDGASARHGLSFWTFGLIGVMVVAGGIFIFL